MLKKLIATAVAAAMIFGLVSVAFAASSPFPDTAGVEQEAVIAKLKALGLVKGDENGMFRPYSTINRAEFTTLVVRMLGLENVASVINTPTVFPDVTEQWSWAYGYINVATSRGLIKGFEDGTFRPGEPVTQAQALTILLRALGYNDNLAGDWPVDYIMKGAELEVIGAGFSGSIGATRALVAEMVANTLDQEPVKEDSESPGTFLDKYSVDGVTLYQDVFGLGTDSERQYQYVSGKVIEVDTDDGEIKILETIDGEDVKTPYDYVSNVVIYGKDSVSELEGQYVEVTFNDDGDIVFIEVTTAGEVVGTITAVDTIDGEVTIGGVKYAVLDDVEIYKNGVLLTGTLAYKLSALVDTDAKLLRNDDGDVYRIDASLLDKEGTLSAVLADWTRDGVTYNIKVTGTDAGTYPVDDDVVVVRNGVSATLGDLEENDDLQFAIVDGEVTYIDAFCQTLERYTLVAVRETADDVEVVLEKDDQQVTYVYGGKTDLYELNLIAGDEYDVTLNRDGEVTSFEASTPEGATTEGDLKKIVAKYVDDEDYKLELDDGSVLVLNEIEETDGIGSVKFNGVKATFEEVEDFWPDIEVDSLVKTVDEDGETGLRFYSPSVSGKVYKVADDGNEYVIGEVHFVTDWDTEVSLNGTKVYVDAVSVPSEATDDFTATVEFTGDDGPAPESYPIASVVEFEDFGNEGAHEDLTVMGILVGSDSYTYKLAAADGSYVEATVDADDVVVIKDGEEVTPADVAIGDKVSYAPEIDYPKVPAYVNAETDDDEPEVVSVAEYVYYNPDADTLTVTVETNEAVAVIYVWADDSEDDFEPSYRFDEITPFSHTIDNVTVRPTKVSVQVVDFAGNVSELYTVEWDGSNYVAPSEE